MPKTNEMVGRTIFISGASRGIGLAIATRCAEAGANVAIAAKTDTPHPKLPGTIHDAAAAIEAAGGRALPLVCDIRDEEAVADAVARTAEHFGGIDVVVNNASAISLTGTAQTPLKRYDLMNGVNSRGTFAVTRAALPYLLKSERPHILTLSPPLDMAGKWFRGHVAYSLAKYGMSLLSLGWAGEFEGEIAVNCLWPRTAIDTAAVRNVLGDDAMAAQCRTPRIMADAAFATLMKPVDFTGWFLLDDLMLAAEGVTNFDAYAITPDAPLIPDFFVPDSAPHPHEADGMVGWRAPTL